ncbi:hybrid sensor histidine kinase/response regulator [Nocardioides nanhaiensis]|uniref:histidine kinase n=1 Tax=Nocardioides nanhaiensis TaxID=1476871 RepID=A0ABP8X350_9ACTN
MTQVVPSQGPAVSALTVVPVPRGWAVCGVVASASLMLVHVAAPWLVPDDLAYSLVLVLAVAGAWVGTLSQPPPRPASTMMAGGLTLWVGGEAFWILQSLQGPVPAVSVADVGYLLGYVGLVGALGSLTLRPTRDRRRPDADVALDLLTALAVSLVVIWTLVGRGVWSDTALSGLERTVLSLYPVGDAVLLALAARVALSRQSRAVAGLWVCAGVLCWLTADLLFLVQSGEDSPLVDLGWMLGVTLMASLTWRRLVVEPGAPALPAAAPVACPQRGNLLVSLASAALPLLAVPVLAVDLVTTRRERPFEATAWMTILLMLTIARAGRLLVAERRAAVELARARDEALAASRAKSQFLATVSHEIRTPLNGVLGLAGLLRATELTARQREYVEGLEQAGAGLVQVIGDVLDFSKLEAGRVELETIGFSVPEVLERVRGTVLAVALERGLRLDVSCAEDVPPRLLGDPQRLGQVLLNLAGNAVKFTHAGEVRLEASLAGREGDRALVRVEVRDTGVGIASEDLERLFQPFSQLDASTTRRFGGTGLGLAICRQLVEAMGGEIGVDSRQGAGSTFWVTVPLLVLADTADAAQATAPGPSPGPAGPAPERGRVLVVDDNDINQLVAEGMLGRLGFEVLLAGDGAAALELLQAAGSRTGEAALVAVLMDVQMPVLDGYETTARLRAHEAAAGLPRLPVIATTAGAVDGDRERALEAGMDDYVPKPLALDRLADALDRWVPAVIDR